MQDTSKPSEVENLMKPPQKETTSDRPRLKAYTPDTVHQADVLYLPNDKGFKYALVVADVNTREADAEPLKSHSSEEVTKAIQRIYKRNILNTPNMFINVDNGSEFKRHFTDWARRHRIAVRVGKTNRHRQQSLVEYVNLILGRALFIRMNAEELMNGKVNTSWRRFLRGVLNDYNEYIQENYTPLNTSMTEKTMNPTSSDPLLKIGTLVRVALDYPQNLYKKRVDSVFRTGDLRWTRKGKPITNIIINPNQPVLYQVNNDDSVAYTRQQLQVVDDKEARQMKPEQMEEERYLIDRIVGKRKHKNKIQYLVKWEGYDDTFNEWKNKSELVQDGLYDEIEKYESNQKAS